MQIFLNLITVFFLFKNLVTGSFFFDAGDH